MRSHDRPEPPCVPRGSRLMRVLRGPESDPWWARPGSIAVLLLAAGMYTWALDASGFGNEYYAAAAYSGSLDWNAWLFGAFDTGSFISVDKPPFSLWVTGLSVRVFGLSHWSVLLPHAVAGVATVLILLRTVRRWHGHAAGLISALALTVTPVFVVMARYNNPDAILTLLLTASLALAYSAACSGSGWRLAAAGGLAGLAFLTKTTQALLVLPAIAVVYLVAAPISVGRRLLHGAGAALAAVVSAGWWILLAETSSSAPFYGQTETGSFLDYVFGYNGLGRVTGEGVGPGDPFGGGGGWVRLFNEEVGGQVSWLIPVAVLALLVGLWMRRKELRTDTERAGWLLWGTFFAVQVITFGLMQGVFHPYYTMTLAPPVAALTGAGSVALWRLYRGSTVGRWVLPAVIVGTGVWGAVVLHRTPDFAPGLGTLVIVLSAAAAVTLVAVRAVGTPGGRIALGTAGLAGAVLLAGPMSYAMASIGTDYSGGDPKAGPGETGRPAAAGPAAPGPDAAVPTGYPVAGPPTGGDGRPLPPVGPDRPYPRGYRIPRYDRPHPADGAGPGDVDGTREALTGFLLSEHAGETWIVATVSSGPAASLVLETGEAVMALGGFGGGDPAPSPEELAGYLGSGELRFVLLTPGNRNAERWGGVVREMCEAVPGQVYGGGGGGGAVLFDCAA